jgi:1,4-dihydroxy-2-naphthoyl-CoA hydrolase
MELNVSDGASTGPRVEGYDLDLSDFRSDASPFDSWLGVRYDLLSPDRVEAHMDVRPDHHQPYGIVHGGVLASLVEGVASIAGSLRALADGRAVVGVHNATDFLRAVTRGRLDVVATPIHIGRTQQLWLVEITREDGKAAARGQLRLAVLDAPPTGA